MKSLRKNEPGRARRRTDFHLLSFAGIAQDVRYSARMLRRSPGFTLVAVIVLALGIGANTAVFSVLSAVLLRPLPFKQPDRLVVLLDDLTARGLAAQFPVPPGVYVDWKKRSRSFQDMAAMAIGDYNLTGKGEPVRLQGVRTTTNLFSLLGMQPILGRTFSATDEGPDASPVVIVSRRLWLQRFGGDPGLIGRSIVLNGSKHTVIGVVPDDVEFPSNNADLWVPAAFTPTELTIRDNHYLYVVGRLKPTVSPGQAQAEMNSIATTLAREYPRTDKGWRATVTALHERLAGTARPALFLLFGAVGIVLLITCANVANLLLARGETRRKELALRQALGAGQGRMLRQLLTEGAVLGGLGLIAGVALSTASFGYLSRLIPATLPQGTSPSLDGRVLAFTAAVTVLAILLFGSGPALAAARIGFSEALKKGGVGRTGAGAGHLRNLLVVGEIGLTVVLLVSAGLLLHSYATVLAVDPGFQPQHLLLAETDLSPSKYTRPEDRRAFSERVLERVRALPGVTAAGYASSKPLSLSSAAFGVTIEGQPASQGKDGGQNLTRAWVVSAGYFSALGVPLIRGRSFDDRDSSEAIPTAVINRAMARQHWPGQNPIGKRFKIGGPESKAPWFTVVGVVGNILVSLDAPPAPVIYRPLRQEGRIWPRYLVVRTPRDPTSLAAAVRRAIWSVEPDQPVSNIQPMTQVVDQQLSNRNTQLTLVGGLAALALLVAAVGLYGVLSYLVAQRTSEIGLRMALGAPRHSVVRSVVRSALVLAITGMFVGMVGALALSRLLTAFLYGVSPTDPITFVAVPVLLVIVTLLASYIPARRATNVDPVSALRME